MREIINNPTHCPNCGKSAEGRLAIETEFGLRNMGNDTIRVQSWCKECRAKYSRSVLA